LVGIAGSMETQFKAKNIPGYMDNLFRERMMQGSVKEEVPPEKEPKIDDFTKAQMARQQKKDDEKNFKDYEKVLCKKLQEE
jgi:hypothetical protein